MSNTLLESVGEIVVTRCWCGIQHGVPKSLYDQAKASKSVGVYCPVGHQWYFCKSDADLLREQLIQKTHHLEQVEASRTRILGERDQFERSLRAQRGASTRLRNRVKHGVCPCCNRTFKQLAAHMADKHPDFKPVEKD